MVMAKSVVLTSDCQMAFRKYSCAVHFPRCEDYGVNSAHTTVRVCRDVCTEYCDRCKLSYCPCGDLPVQNCTGLDTFCSAAQCNEGGVAGRCPDTTSPVASDACQWHQFEQVPQLAAAGQGRAAPPSAVAWALLAIAAAVPFICLHDYH